MGKRDLLASVLESTCAGNLLSLTVARWHGLVVFNYHRIGNPQETELDRALYSASAQEFENQVRFLKRNFDVVRIADLHLVLNDPAAQAVMITFDDGYRDNYELALPILKANGTPALFFIASGYLDDQPVSWWDEVAWMVRSSAKSEIDWQKWFSAPLPLQNEAEISRAIKELLLKLKAVPEEESTRFLDELGQITETGRCDQSVIEKLWMTWDMVREMDHSGMDIGGHTVNHPVLANCDSSRQRSEIQDSKQRIETEIGHQINAFSYPVGQQDSFTDETKELLREAGYDWGFSFYGGYCPPVEFDPYDLKRMPVEKHLNRNLFRSIARLPQIFARK